MRPASAIFPFVDPKPGEMPDADYYHLATLFGVGL
jgi:hypothetical protein